jgi:hypothetical protein
MSHLCPHCGRVKTATSMESSMSTVIVGKINKLKAQLKQWKDACRGWETAYTRDIRPSPSHPTSPPSQEPRYDWGGTTAAESARLDRVAKEAALMANAQRSFAEMVDKSTSYQWDPAPGDPDFVWNRERGTVS